MIAVRAVKRVDEIDREDLLVIGQGIKLCRKDGCKISRSAAFPIDH